MLAPLETLYDTERGAAVSLPPLLTQLYGRLQFPDHAGRPYIISNFVSTLDGVVALGMPGHEGGSEISGANQHDRMVMGLLRAVADAVVVGAETLRASPRHLWTAEYIYPSLADQYRQIRQSLKKPASPLNVIVTASGKIDPCLPVFRSGQAPALIVATVEGASRISNQSTDPSPRIIPATTRPRLCAREIIDAVVEAYDNPSPLILVEGGPQLLSNFFAERLLDEQFLTLAPQVAGRNDASRRPGLVDGKILAPDSPIWGELIGVKRGAEHLFLRYGFER